MDCDEVRGYLLDFLYNELSDEQRMEVEEHLAYCEACLKEKASLGKTMEVLKNWKDVEPKTDLIFVDQKSPLKERISGGLSWLPRPAVRTVGIAAFVVMAFLTILSALHTEWRVENGSLSVKMSLFGPKQPEHMIVETPEGEIYLMAGQREMDERYIGQLQAMAYVMESVIYASEQRQRRSFLLALGQVFEELQRQNQGDKEVIQWRLDNLENHVIELKRTNLP